MYQRKTLLFLQTGRQSTTTILGTEVFIWYSIFSYCQQLMHVKGCTETACTAKCTDQVLFGRVEHSMQQLVAEK